MANLVEQAVYAAGVFQLETTTPVQGGPNGASNAPLKNLADRTAYLKQQTDALGQAAGFAAPLNSPVFTGTPTVPDVTPGSSSGAAVNARFVMETLGGVFAKNVAGSGNFPLTSADVGKGILLFTGALTGNAVVIMPDAPVREWIAINRTTGAFTLTIKTAAGTGVALRQGKQASLFNLSGNIARAETDFSEIVLEGIPLAPTAPIGSNDQQIANTQWVDRRGHRFAPGGFRSGVSSVGAADAGKVFYVGFAGATITLPPSTSAREGDTYTFFCEESVFTLQAQAIDGVVLRVGSSGYSSMVFRRGGVVTVVMTSFGYWSVTGDAIGEFSSQFQFYKAQTGFQRLPSGVIMQWGLSSPIASTTGVFQIFPIVFPVLACAVVISHVGADISSSTVGTPNHVTLLDSAKFSIRNNGVGTAQFYWQAIGY